MSESSQESTSGRSPREGGGLEDAAGRGAEAAAGGEAAGAKEAAGQVRDRVGESMDDASRELDTSNERPGEGSADPQQAEQERDQRRQEKADRRRDRAMQASTATAGPAGQLAARGVDKVKDQLVRKPLRSAGLGAVVDSSPAAKLAGLAAGMFLMIVLMAGGGAVYTQAASCKSNAEEAIASQSTASLQGVPKKYVRFYIGAAEKYGLGERGPSIIAGIHKVESNFGTSTLPGVHSGSNSAGAQGPMQFLADTWASQGVDGDHDGDKDVYDPADAIYGTANYLHNSGAPGDWYKAVFAYNHADWYVQEVENWAEKFDAGGSTSTEVSQTTQPSSIDSDASVSGVSKAYSDFAVLVARGTGLSLRVVGGWALAEGGPDDNPLNIGPGKTYGSIEAGAKATIALLHTSLYKGVIASADKSDSEQMDAIAASPWCPGCDGYRQLLQRTYDSVQAHGDPGSTTTSDDEGEECKGSDDEGASGPAQLQKAVRLTEPQTYTNVPAKYMNAGRAPEPFDTRLLPDLIWILNTYDLRVNAARETGHHTHGDGTAVDLAPYKDTASIPHWDETAKRLAEDLGWNSGCAASGTAPVCPLVPAIQFVGYNGYDSAHGDPAHSGSPHIHVSWRSDCYGCGGGALVDPREWVMAFPAPGVDLGGGSK